MKRVAIAQIAMHGTTTENLAAIERMQACAVAVSRSASAGFDGHPQ